MIKSLALYSNYLLKITSNGNLKYLSGDLARYSRGERSFHDIPACSREHRETSLHKVIRWLQYAQQKSGDHGMASFHLASGWGSSYPETTGYIIPSLLEYASRYRDAGAREAARKAAGFLVEIQRPSGGWQGGRIGENRPEIVFNTGQVLRGMTAAYREFGEDRFLQAAIKGAQWLCEVQHPDGYWKEHALMNQARVYDAFVDAPLLQLFKMTSEVKFRDAALKNLHWIIDHKMQQNGWFEDCDNTIKRNQKPILHTIAYTLDGLIESDDFLKEGLFFKSALPAAEELKRQLLETGRLHGRYDRDWRGWEFLLCTGVAQMAIVWMRIFRTTGEPTWLKAADRALDILIHVQGRDFDEEPDTAGALPGSYPIWGRYEPFAFPNWASKFFADALLMRLEIPAQHG